MSLWARKASLVMVAASIAAMEVLKDQGFTRWNYPIRQVNQHLQTRVGSYLARPTQMEDAVLANDQKEGTASRLEANHRKIMQLGCWGPESIRF